MPLIIGTAGHIDHGKTSLIRALTGQETDRLKEEQERGISIDLGFAYLETPEGVRAGIVDVPGHERFIRNMLAGAHGMHLVLFTVAADDGIMPQTEEHLDILHLLGVRRGIFVITKTDLVDAARVRAVHEDIEVLTLDTTLEGSPILPVSTHTGAGIEALRHAILGQLAQPTGPVPAGYFRLPVDRAFVMHGHGIVVTGTSVAGTLAEGDAIRLLPGGEMARVRNLEVHGRPVPRVGHGQRVAMNLAGVERADIGRGHVVCHERIVRTTDRIDAWLEVRPGVKKALASHTRVRVHVGTAEVVGKVIVLDRDAIAPRTHGWVQLVLTHPIVALRGDRFVVRDETARWTLGGGDVVHPFAERHRRGDGTIVPTLERLRGEDRTVAAGALLDAAAAFAVERDTVVQALNLDDAEAAAALAAVPSLLPIPNAEDPECYSTTAKWERFDAAVLAAVKSQHATQPLLPGLEMESVRTGLPWEVSSKVFRWGIDRMVAAKRLVRDDSIVRSPHHKVALGSAGQALALRVERALAEGGFTPPDLRLLEEQLGEPRRRIDEVLRVLEKEKRAVRVAPDLYWAPDAVEAATGKLAEYCRTHGEITAGVFRDLIGASRKFAIAFLDWCDRTGVTTRVGDARRLRR